MVSSLNFGKISVDDNGKVTVSGNASGVNISETVSAIIAAKKIPIDNISTKITANQKKVQYLGDLKTLMTNLQDSISVLRGAFLFQGSGNVFNNKTTSTASSRTDGGLATTASSIMTVTAGNNAINGSYDAEVMRLAKAHKVAGDTFTSKTTALNNGSMLGGGFTGGVIEIEGRAVSISATATLTDVANSINSLNTGQFATGVSATIVSIGASSHKLVLTNAGTGQDIRVTRDDDDVLKDLGIIDSSLTDFKNVLQESVSSRIKLTGITDIDRFESKKYSTDSTALNLTGTLNVDGNAVVVGAGDSLNDIAANIDALTGISAQVFEDEDGFRLEITKDDNTALTITNTSGTLISDMKLDNTQIAERAGSTLTTDADRFTSKYYTDKTAALGLSGDIIVNGNTYTIGAGDDLEDIAAGIDALAGVGAKVISEGGVYRLVITGDNNAALTINDTGGVKTALGVDNTIVTKGSGNTINDIFTGVTMTLLKAEEGTSVDINVDNDRTAVKEAVKDFVDQYNELQKFYNINNATDPTTGSISEDAILYGSQALKTSYSGINSLLGQAIQGVSGSFAILAQVGVSFIDNRLASDSTQHNTLKVDEATLDNALANNFDDVKRLFAFNYTSSNSQLEYISHDGNTAYNAAGFNIDITSDGTQITAATIDGSAANVSISGNQLTITGGAAKGLVLFYTGTTNATGIQVNYTNGIASNMFFDINNLMKETTGVIDAESDAITATDKSLQSRVDRMTRQLENYKNTLTAKYVAMESSVSYAQTILNSINQYAASLQSS